MKLDLQTASNNLAGYKPLRSAPFFDSVIFSQLTVSPFYWNRQLRDVIFNSIFHFQTVLFQCEVAVLPLTYFEITHTRTHARTHAHTHTYTRVHANTHTRTHAHTHARWHAHTQTNTHAHTHARMQVNAGLVVLSCFLVLEGRTNEGDVNSCSTSKWVWFVYE